MTDRRFCARWTTRWAPVAVLLLLAVGSGCSSSTAASAPGTTKLESPGPPQNGGVMSIGLPEESRGWDPTKVLWLISNYTEAWAIFDPLAAFDADGQVQPYLASAFVPNATFTDWTIRLRPGVRFHDGTPVDGAAVKKNLDAHRNSLVTGSAITPIVGIDVTDPLTVQVHMSTPWSTFPSTLVGQVGAIAAPAMLDAADGATKPVGSGPFEFDSWNIDSTLTVRRNPTYWQPGLPHLDKIVFHTIPDAQARSKALEAGDVDLAMSTSPSDMGQFAATPEAKFKVASTEGIQDVALVIGLNSAKAPFDDPVAREALDRALDRPEMSAALFDGAFPPAYSPFEPTSRYFVDVKAKNQHDADAARRLAAQYEASHGHKISLQLTVVSSPELATMAQLVQQQLQDVGIDVTIDRVDVTKGVIQVLAGQYQAFAYEMFGAPNLDVNYTFFASKPGGPDQLSPNLVRLFDPELTGAMDRARATDDPAQQFQAYQQAQERLADDHALLPVIHKRTALISSTRVQGVSQYVLPNGQPSRFGFSTNVFFGGLWIER